MTFFCKFALDSRAIELADGINNFIKGVIEILSSKVKLRNFDIQHEDEIGNSTCTDCLYPAVNGRLYSNIGVGLLFYPC